MTTHATPTTITAPRRTGASPAPQGRIYNHELHELVVGTLYTGLMTNLLLVVATAPLVVMLATTDPAVSWPALAVLSPLLAPAVAAAFSVFGAFTSERSVTVVRTFWRSWWRHLRRSLAVGAGLAAVVTVAGLNTRFFLHHAASPPGAAVIPAQVVLAGVALVTGVVCLGLLAERPGAPLGRTLRTCLALGVRRWYVMIPAAGALGVLSSLLVERPAIALGVAAAPVLFIVWGACRFALHPVLHDPSTS